ncbi:MAG: biotin-dependent carboxyltransferase family protein, partial [Bacteroidia bacterium]|nr:biotin-dependent carboxyltransferase family protein [Bacteroidia bacterium]
ANGFETELLMGSRSMYNNITSASRIQNDDILSIVSVSSGTPTMKSKKSDNKDYFDTKKLTAYKGPEFDLLSNSSQDKLFNQEFTISNTHSRMGYQLNEFLENDLKSILTSHVLPGTVQLTPSGKLLVLMRDAQTTGGYPRVLQLSESAINIMAQKNTNDKISFKREELTI